MLANLAGGGAPQAVERRGLVGDLASRLAKEREGAAGPELDADDAVLRCGIDGEAAGAGAGEGGDAAGGVAIEVVGIVEAHRLVAQVEDQRGLAVRHEALAGVRLGRPFPEPEAADEGGQGRRGNVQAVHLQSDCSKEQSRCKAGDKAPRSEFGGACLWERVLQDARSERAGAKSSPDSEIAAGRGKTRTQPWASCTRIRLWAQAPQSQ